MTQLVCVTGASGFIAAHIVRDLLERGYRVRGTVRSLSDPGKYGYLTSLPGASERLELYEAELHNRAAFQVAISGCEVVLHTASPYALSVKDPQADLVDPAVAGTRNVLEACLNAESVRRVVVTSSMAAVTDETNSDKVFSEADWNEKSSLERNPYYYSKVLAERACWDFVEEQKTGYDVVVINPAVVVGPSLGPSLNFSNQLILDILSGVYPGVLDIGWGLVDVRDVALAHILALETPQASGRYACTAENWDMRRLVGALVEHYPDYKLPRRDMTSSIGTALARLISYTQPKGVGSYMRTHLGGRMLISNEKIRAELGIVFRPVDQTVVDTVEDLIRWEHLAAPR